jgi:hypothetical protein
LNAIVISFHPRLVALAMLRVWVGSGSGRSPWLSGRQFNCQGMYPIDLAPVCRTHSGMKLQVMFPAEPDHEKRLTVVRVMPLDFG